MLGVDVADETFFRLEVERHGVALVRVVAHLEHGCAYERLARVVGGVAHTCGVDQTAVHAHGHLLALKIHVLILDLGVAVEVGET